MNHYTFRDGRLEHGAFDCVCGRRHELPIDEIVVRRGALDEVVPVVKRLALGSKCVLVSDANTREVAGARVEADLGAAGYGVRRCFFATREGVKPDEKAVGELMLAMDGDTDFLVVAGSGCLTDLTRFVASRTGVPFVSVATAPSMDGYASSGAPMTHHGHKRTIYCGAPRAIVADVDVLAAAPQPMVASGFSDTIGKLTSRIDWKLSSIARDEYYCPFFVERVNEGVEQAISVATGLRAREPDAIRTLTESLVISGIAMLLVGNSRPASGSEHSLSHYWEMKAAVDRRREFFHGTKVGVATAVVAAFNERFFARDPSSVRVDSVLARRPGIEWWEERLRSSLGDVANGIVAEVTRPQYLSEEALRAEIAGLTERWSEIQRLGADSPTFDEVIGIQREAGAPLYPSAIDVSPEYLRETLLNAKEMRSRYTVLRAAESLGWLEEIADEVVERVSDADPGA